MLRAALIAIGDGVLWGCSLHDGHRRRLNPPSPDEFQNFSAARLVGTRVVFVDRTGDHYGDGDERLILDRAVGAGHRVVVARAQTFYEPRRLRSVRLGADGTVAWLDAHAGVWRLWLWRPGDVARAVDEGPALTAVTLVPGTLGWSHGTAPRSVSTTAPDGCPAAGRRDGTVELDLFDGPDGAVACWRASGATAMLPATRAQDVVAAGAWIAASTFQQTILVANVVTGATRVMAVPGRVWLVVDEGGSVAWVQSDEGAAAPFGFTIWADDAAGTHQLGTVHDLLYGLSHDGPTVRWSVASPGQSGTATLSDA
jgi:hypothetical protein